LRLEALDLEGMTKNRWQYWGRMRDDSKNKNQLIYVTSLISTIDPDYVSLSVREE
jgi:hypothetical protein